MALGLDIKGAGEAVGALGTLAKDIRAAITGKEILDPDTELKLAQLDAEVMKAQAAINLVEAGSSNWFVSNWRPALGWICTSSYAIRYMLAPLLGIFNISVPSMNTEELWPMLAGLLGLGTLRTVEKIKKVASK